jgi:hypothetical protein
VAIPGDGGLPDAEALFGVSFSRSRRTS